MSQPRKPDVRRIRLSDAPDVRSKPRHPIHYKTEANVFDDENPLRERPETADERKRRLSSQRSRFLREAKKRNPNLMNIALSHCARLHKDGHPLPIHFDIVYKVETGFGTYTERLCATANDAWVQRHVGKEDEPETTHLNSSVMSWTGTKARNRAIPPLFTVRMSGEIVSGFAE